MAAAYPPVDLPPEEFRRHGHAVIDQLTEYYQSLTELPVWPGVSPVDLAALFDAPAPESAEPISAILNDFSERIVPNSSIQGSPRFFGWVNGGGTQIGTLAETLAAGLNPNPGGWGAAQAAAVIEVQTIRWFVELMGLATTSQGLFVSGGTMANTTGLRLALHDFADWDISADGLQGSGAGGRLTVYMADHESHASFLKALDLLGLGRSSLRLVPSNPDFTIDTAALETMLDADTARGMRPFCIVGHAGSINVGAFDNLDRLATIAEHRDLWLHVDGACGGLAAILPEFDEIMNGLDRADSISFDAHKWMGVPYECGCIIARDGGKLRETFGVTANYLAEAAEDSPRAAFDFFDRGPQMSRGWRALKVWMSLRHYGAEGYRAFFRRTIANAKLLHSLVEEHPDWEVVQPAPQLYIYSFRYRPTDGGLTDGQLDRLNSDIAHEIRHRQVALIMTTKIRDRVTQRFSIANHRTTETDIREVFGEMTAVGHLLAESLYLESQVQ